MQGMELPDANRLPASASFALCFGGGSRIIFP